MIISHLVYCDYTKFSNYLLDKNLLGKLAPVLTCTDPNYRRVSLLIVHNLASSHDSHREALCNHHILKLFMKVFSDDNIDCIIESSCVFYSLSRVPNNDHILRLLKVTFFEDKGSRRDGKSDVSPQSDLCA